MTGSSLVLPLRASRPMELVGGKAARLAELLAAGFPVPGGFTITTDAFHLAGDGMPAELAEQIAAAYRQLGSPPVAVRSSATAEDLGPASLAGQCETILDVRGEEPLLAAVGRCWSSLHSDRARAYFAEHGIAAERVAMAVVVQRLVPAEVAGVLFTANPRTGARDELLIEASWGLGEAVVSGRVQPDTLTLDRATGAVKSAVPGDASRGASGAEEAAPPRAEGEGRSPRTFCLTARHVLELWRLGCRAAQHFGDEQDIEWAIADGQVHVLQARPITTLAATEAVGRCLDETRARLRAAAQAGRGGWVLHNLAETLPHPTPLTWSVMRRFMAGDGGFGRLYRSVGFEPGGVVCRDGFLELVAGRIYMDVARAPEMFFADFPYRYDLERLRREPDSRQGPPTLPAGSWQQRARVARRLAAVNRQLRELARDLDRRLDNEIIPEFERFVQREKACDLRRLSTAEWLERWRQRETAVLDQFAPQSLLPSLVAAMARDELRRSVEELFWDDEPRELVDLLTAELAADQSLLAAQALFELAHGRGALEQWLLRYGHRGPEEFDLASPRWRETPEEVLTSAARLKEGPSPLELHARRAAQAEAKLAELSGRLQHQPAERRRLESQVALARRYLRFREDGKHYLMLGYDLLRDLALEAGRRLETGNDVFLLTLEEVQQSLTTGFAPLALIEQRRAARAAETKLSLPDAIASSDIDSLGHPSRVAGSQWQLAFPISAGVGTGPARIVLTPQGAGDLGQGYVLVCPSTDPSWTPLFVGAAGLVLERGGTLSHGAVVARELGIQAVVCPNATVLFQEGERLTVDGHHGAVSRGETGTGIVCEDSRSLPRELIPPPRGRRERRGAIVRNVCLAGWCLLLAAAFLLPDAWLYRPGMRGMDALLWPVVRAWGKPGAVIATGAVLAVAGLVGQRFLTDHHRLREAKRRAAALRKLAAGLPADSPRRQAMLRLAASVPSRLAAAAMLPLALLLGPMILPLACWFPARVDPAAANPRPGATAHVVALIDGEYAGPVTLTHAPELHLDETTPAVQTLPPLRAALESRLTRWQRSSDLSSLPWELQESGRWLGRQLVDDLQAYLAHGIPPQPLTWTLQTPAAEPGRYALTLTAGDAAPLSTRLVVGDAWPPAFAEDVGEGRPAQAVRGTPGNPVRLVKVTYFAPKQPGQDVFWAPLTRIGCRWDAGWLWTYLAAYLPVLFLLRWLLRIP